MKCQCCKRGMSGKSSFTLCIDCRAYVTFLKIKHKEEIDNLKSKNIEYLLDVKEQLKKLLEEIRINRNLRKQMDRTIDEILQEES